MATNPARSERVRRVLITGASGYIGRRLAIAARASGFDVAAAVRDPRRLGAGPCTEARPFDLAAGSIDDELCRGIDAVVHLAAILNEDSRPAGVEEDLNVSGTRRLIETARRQGVRRFVFLSSQSAAADARTKYGRSKWEIEQLLTGNGDCSVRTGLVSGGPPRALYGVLFRLSKRLPALPVVRPAAPVYPVHVDDLCAGLLSLVASEHDPPRLVRIAAAESMPFGAYVRMLARARFGRRVRSIPIPARPILLLSRWSERLPFVPTISSERVEGLMALRAMEPDSMPSPPDAPPLRDVAAILATEGHRRRLLVEARTLMRYVVGPAVPRGAWRRYVRAVQAEPDDEPLELPMLVQTTPALLRWSEPVGRRASARLRRRLSLATRIVEMTPAAATTFHSYRERPRLLAWSAVGWLLFVEAALLPVRWILGRPRNGPRADGRAGEEPSGGRSRKPGPGQG